MFKKLATLALSITLLVSWLSVSNGQEAKDGKTIFEASKCLTCHSVNSLAIEGKKKDKSIDLSNAGANHTSDELKTFLKKESEYKGKKHAIAFKGEDADFQILSDWLLTLKETK